MGRFISFTFGGLSRGYYLRHLIFGAAFPVLMFALMAGAENPMGIIGVVLPILLTLLYPYSRFVYERVVAFIMGDNVFFVSTFLMIMVKLFMMLLCWALSPFIAPIWSLPSSQGRAAEYGWLGKVESLVSGSPALNPAH
ncbi:hypothetical protein [Pseudomonas protegens]|uniref:hypothetical protein n=1 Tax=Pseudomonas protegens TaxID=380021 RepID=UPI001F2EC706|nr:hypothetical protein [Pseudomonas protegens]